MVAASSLASPLETFGKALKVPLTDGKSLRLGPRYVVPLPPCPKRYQDVYRFIKADAKQLFHA
jgi:hypothetical protein